MENTIKHSERFTRAIDALVKGYFNGTLAKGSCAACAVGNMVAAGYGASMYIDAFGYPACDKRNAIWGMLFSTTGEGDQKTRSIEELIEDWDAETAKLAQENIGVTGYSIHELMRIEGVFENATKINLTRYRFSSPKEIDADQYRGLMAVVDVLCEIEGITDAEPFKAMFTKAEADI